MLQGPGLRFAFDVVRRQLAGPLGEKGHLSVAVGDILIPFAGEKRQRIGWLQESTATTVPSTVNSASQAPQPISARCGPRRRMRRVR